MARKKIREYDSKRLLKKFLKKYCQYDVALNPVQVHSGMDWDTLLKENPWLKDSSLILKPDMLFGQRGKYGLIVKNIKLEEMKKKINEKLNARITLDRQVTRKGTTETVQYSGDVSHFILEPFLPHEDKDECYLSITLERIGHMVRFSRMGGVNVEENWDTVKELAIPVLDSLKWIAENEAKIKKELFEGLAEEKKSPMFEFIVNTFKVYHTLHFTMMEFNPILVHGGKVIPLDMRGELDDCADKLDVWEEDIVFPPPFGRSPTKEEEYIRELDGTTGGSLKLTILNRDGLIWNMVAGGGASVVYADTVCNLGYGNELGNYGEYSGNPPRLHTRDYCLTMLDLAIAASKKRKETVAFILGGGIANFTDVAATFKGIIEALETKVKEIMEADIKFYCRRGGPNYEEGLRLLKEKSTALGLSMEVYDPSYNMTFPVPKAVKDVFEK